MVTADLFDDVDLPGRIGAPRRDANAQFGIGLREGLEPDRGEIARDRSGIEFGVEDQVDFLSAKLAELSFSTTCRRLDMHSFEAP